ncbi:CwfJ C-terminus 1-domain-containing protein-like protein [Entophlyctis helioformis]|nr:CwfJ C-terminus 1-domain-containing protein-like protein [Entophlyctis helioformis]
MTQDGVGDVFGFSAPAAVRKSQKELEREADEARRLAIRRERELNTSYVHQSNADHQPVQPQQQQQQQQQDEAPKRKFEFGDKGANWRMMKLKRVFDIAKEDGLKVDDVALERYGSLESFQEALDERAFLDKAKGLNPKDSLGSHRSSIRPSSSSGFRMPGAQDSPRQEQLAKDTQRPSVSTTQRMAVIPSALQPASRGLAGSVSGASGTDADQGPAMSKDELNKLNAQIIKARLMKLPTLKELEDRYAREKARAEGRSSSAAAPKSNVVVLPTVDDRGRLYDLGVRSSTSAQAGQDQGQQQPSGSQRKRPFETDTHDKEGNRVRYSRADDAETLADMVLQEKLGRGTSIDEDMAHRIAKDTAFRDDLDYIDDGADRFAKKKEMTDDRKRNAMITDYRRTQEAQDKCMYCFNDGKSPRASVAALGIKAYLAMPETISMVPGHCLIVPVQHVLTTLELEDDAWDEIRNFQKCLMQMAAANNQGVLFMEQVINFKWHKHTVIECIPVSKDLHEDAPAYFREALNSADEEWSQHKKVINTGDRGFRRSMVKNLPYFHVWFDPNRGFGHVIEDAAEWRTWFGREVIASVMDLPPDKWRKPRRPSPQESSVRLKEFLAKWKPFDWTAMLDGGQYDG